MPTAHRQLPLTAKELLVHRFVDEYVQRNRYAPSLKEVQAEMGAKWIGSANACLKAIERKGYIVRIPRVARGLKILKRPPKRAR